MRNPICLLAVILFFFQNSGECQVSINKEKASTLFKESSSLYDSFRQAQISNTDSARILSKLLIARYLEIYQIDTTNTTIGDNLSELYALNGDYSKAMAWEEHQIIVKESDSAIKYHLEFIAYYFIQSGELDSSINYIKISCTLGKKLNIPIFFLERIIEYAYWLNKGFDTNSNILLKSKGINPCYYSIQILKTVFPYTKKINYNLFHPLTKSIIKRKEKNCR